MAESQAIAPNSIADAAQASYDVDVFATSTTHQYQAYLNEIPDDWMIRTLGEVATVVGGGTPSRDTESFWNGDIPWVTPGEISEEESKYLTMTAERITAAGLAGSGANLLPLGALMVTTRATLGARAIAGAPMATNQGFKSLVFSSPTDADFYFYLAPKFKPELVRRASGTTFLEISLREFAQIEVPCPPTAEKKRIAQILDTLDTTIRQTEAIIAKLKLVKQGLLHDLLTRGIDANGELRPPQPQAPHLYKPSPLGWIPKEWDVRPLARYTSSDITYGIVQAGPNIEHGVPYIRTGDMLDDGLDRASLLCTSRRIADSYKRSEVHVGDLVIAIRATVGKVLPVPADLDGANLTQGTARIAPNARTDPTFLLWAIRHHRAQQSILSEIKGTTFAEITLADLRQVPLAAPTDVQEQRQIGERLQAGDDSIRSLCRELAKLQLQKSGLMDDLLTGRVRVTPLLEAAATP
jgi:type I restriction enzyme S subunit